MDRNLKILQKKKVSFDSMHKRFRTKASTDFVTENDSETWSLIWKEEEEEEEKVKTASIVLHRFPFFIFYFFFSVQEKLGFQLTARDSKTGMGWIQWREINFGGTGGNLLFSHGDRVRIIATIRGDCLNGDKANNVYGEPPNFHHLLFNIL